MIRFSICFLILLTSAIIACEEPAAGWVQNTNNPGIAPERLADVDGCTIYRFHDMGRAHYFARCPNTAPTTEMHEEPCGKSCSYAEATPTSSQ